MGMHYIDPEIEISYMLKQCATPDFVQRFMFQLTLIDHVDAANITEAMNMTFAVRSRRKMNQDYDELFYEVDVWPTV